MFSQHFSASVNINSTLNVGDLIVRISCVKKPGVCKRQCVCVFWGVYGVGCVTYMRSDRDMHG